MSDYSKQWRGFMDCPIHDFKSCSSADIKVTGLAGVRSEGNQLEFSVTLANDGVYLMWRNEPDYTSKKAIRLGAGDSLWSDQQNHSQAALTHLIHALEVAKQHLREIHKPA